MFSEASGLFLPKYASVSRLITPDALIRQAVFIKVITETVISVTPHTMPSPATAPFLV